MNEALLPGEGYDFLGESQELGEVFLAFSVDEVVEVLPVEDELNKSTILERSEESADVNIGDIGALVGLGGEVLVEDDHSLLEQVSVDGLFL
jgi:tryptophan synthase beta subunit